MNPSNHTVTLPLEDYEELKERLDEAERQVEKWKRPLSGIQDFISFLLDEVKDPDPIIEEFNNRRDTIQIVREGKEITFKIDPEGINGEAI
jgi:uncharacterized coiled-coil DUF342 family protein